MIESAVTDLPLPDSPTSPSVSPARISKLTSSTAGTGPDGRSKTVVRSLDAQQRIGHHRMHGQSHVDHSTRVLELAEHRAHRVGDLADRRARLDGGDDRRHEVGAARARPR